MNLFRRFFKKGAIAGFTLIEMLVTTFVSFLVIGSILVALVNSLVLDEYNEKFSIALNIARGKIEAALSDRVDFENIVSQEGVINDEATKIKGLWRQDVANVGLDDHLKSVEVKVCWQGRNGRVIGDCRDSDNDGLLDEWTGPNSPCTLKTAIAKR